MVAQQAVFDGKWSRLGSVILGEFLHFAKMLFWQFPVVAGELLNRGFLTQRPKKCIIVV
jgi:hypothetical protein